MLSFEPGNAKQLASRLEALLAMPEREREEMGEKLRRIVERDHEVKALMAKLVRLMRGAGHE